VGGVVVVVVVVVILVVVVVVMAVLPDGRAKQVPIRLPSQRLASLTWMGSGFSVQDLGTVEIGTIWENIWEQKTKRSCVQSQSQSIELVAAEVDSLITTISVSRK